MSERIEEIKRTIEALSGDDLVGAEDYCEDVSYLLDEIECFKAKTSPESLGYGEKWKQKAMEAREERDRLRKEIEEANEEFRRTRITMSVHEGNLDSYSRECERLRGKLEEAQQDLKLSKQLIELDTEAMNKDLVTISRLKKIANDALGCMVIMSAADNEHVQRIKSGLEALGE